MSLFVLMSPLTSTIVAPALDLISDDLAITEPTERIMCVSVFVLGFAFGPLVASPLSEVYGRTRVVRSWNLLYLAFNTACGGAPTAAALLVLRFLAGLFGSATLGIGGGTLGDLFTAKERGKAVAVYSVAVLAGPILGPILGGVVSQHLGWRWVFFIASIIDVAVQLLGFVFLSETFAPVLLQRRQRRRDRESGRPPKPKPNPLQYVRMRLRQNLGRAVVLLGTQPIVQVLALYNAFLYGIVYSLYATFSQLWTQRYHQSETTAGLHYLSLGVGAIFAGEVCTHIMDRTYAVLSQRNGGNGKPEFRIPLMLPASVSLGVGLLWYGWSAQRRLFWIMPDIGNAFFMAGAVTCNISVNAYVVDTYGKYSASALAAVTTLRSLASFAFPLFAPYMYARLDYGWTTTVLALLAWGIGLPAVVMLWRFGERLREKSDYIVST